MSNIAIIEEIKRVQSNIDIRISTIELNQDQQELISDLTHMVLLYQQAMKMAIEEKEKEISNLNAGLIYIENFMKEKKLLADFLQYIGNLYSKKGENAEPQ